MENQRFYKCNETEIASLIDKTKNHNTESSTKTWVNVFQSWAKERGFPQEVSAYEPENLDKTLCIFYTEIRKRDGNQYEPDCLRVMRSSLDRYLHLKNYPKSILNDDVFKKSNTVLEGKARELRDKGMGQRPNKALAISKREEEILWKSGQLGSETPQAIINTLWFYSTQHFGLRGRQEHVTMMIEDFTTSSDDDGNEYFTFSEKRTKTRNEGLHPKPGQKNPKMFATNGPRCVVKLFKLFKSKRPAECREKGRFYLQVIKNPSTEIWFKAQPMGKNAIGEIMKIMKMSSPLLELCPEKRLTNHTARKTLVKKLQSQGVPRSDIITVTGHTSTRGLDAYDEGDENQQRMLSNIIDGVGQSTKTSSTSAALLSPAPLSTTNKSRSLSINGQSAITPQSQDQGINPLQPSVRPWPVQSCVSSSAQQSNFHFPAVPSGGYNFMQLPFRAPFPKNSLMPAGPVVQNFQNCTVNISLAPQQPSRPKRQRIESLSDFDLGVDLNLFSELL